MKLVQVDPSEAVKIYAAVAERPPTELMERVLQRFMDSGLKCCRIEDEHYTPEAIRDTLSRLIMRKKLKDQVLLRKNLSKVYIVRK